MPQTNKKKILITEDDINLLMLYELKLKEAGFTVELARNGSECVNKALNFKPDIILLDLMMPKLNGFDTLKILKDDKKTKDTPVVILSNLGQPDDINLAMDLGAKDYIIKSRIDLNDIAGKIKEYLEQ